MILSGSPDDVAAQTGFIFKCRHYYTKFYNFSTTTAYTWLHANNQFYPFHHYLIRTKLPKTKDLKNISEDIQQLYDLYIAPQYNFGMLSNFFIFL